MAQTMAQRVFFKNAGSMVGPMQKPPISLGFFAPLNKIQWRTNGAPQSAPLLKSA